MSSAAWIVSASGLWPAVQTVGATGCACVEVAPVEASVLEVPETSELCSGTEGPKASELDSLGYFAAVVSVCVADVLQSIRFGVDKKVEVNSQGEEKDLGKNQYRVLEQGLGPG
jgi:hypothetical protein